jgi:integrase
VIILSMHANEEYVLQTPRAGACGYLLKDAVVAELELALGAVTRGETYLGFFAYPRKRALNRYNAGAAIRQRAKAAGFLTLVGCHTWRATGITIYLENDGRLEHAQQMAGHESPRTTKHTLRRGACSLRDSQ